MSNTQVPMDESEWLIKMAHLKALEQQADKIRKELAGRAPAEFVKGSAKLPSGQIIGTVSRKAGYTKWTVSDPVLFRDFVASKHPEQLVMAVDPEFKKHLMGRARHETIPGTKSTYVLPTFETKVMEGAYEEFWLEQAENPDFAAMLDLA